MKQVRLVVVTILALCLLGVLPQASNGQVAGPQFAPAQDAAPGAVPDMLPAAASFAYQGSWWPSNGTLASYDTGLVNGRMVSGDFDGNGRADVAVLSDSGDSNSVLEVWRPNGSSFGPAEKWWGLGPLTFQGSAVDGRLVSGDFNGDGMDDIAGMYYYGGSRSTLFVWLSQGTSFSYNSWWECGAGCYDASAMTGRMVAGDFDGDGMDDIAAMYSYGALHVWLSTGSGFKRSPVGNENDGWWRNGSYDPGRDTGRMVAGDFNRDGLDDIAALHDFGDNKAGMNVWESTRSAFVYQGDAAWWPCMSTDCYPAGRVSGRVVSADFNGDGRDDVAALYDYGGAESTLHVWLSAGGSFNYQNNNSGWWQSGAGQYSAPSVTGRFVAGDFDGDGRADTAAMYDYGKGQSDNSRAQLHTWLASGRSVYFLALGDVHSNSELGLATLDRPIALLPPNDSQTPYRGLIAAGDLVWNSDYWFYSTVYWNSSICTRSSLPGGSECPPAFVTLGGAYKGRIWYNVPASDREQRNYIYDGWGNHDQGNTVHPEGQLSVWEDEFLSLRDRNRIGQYPADQSGGHYSWDWNGVHFVMLNLIASSRTSWTDFGGSCTGNPMGSMGFLADDLLKHAGDKPVVIVQHCPPDLITETALLSSILAPYRVVAFVHGHDHEPADQSQPHGPTEVRDVTIGGRRYWNVRAGAALYGHWTGVELHEQSPCSAMTVYSNTNSIRTLYLPKRFDFPDLDKPIVTAQVQRVQGKDCSLLVTLTAVDPPDPREWGCASGVNDKGILYMNTAVGYDWTKYSAPFRVAEDTTVYYQAQDKAGNWSDTGSLELQAECRSYAPMIKR